MASILNLTMEQKVKLYELYDEIKRKYEKKLERGLRSFFRTIADDLLIFYSEFGQIQSLDDYERILETILLQSYRETSDYFSKHYEREMEKQRDEGDDSDLLAFLILLRKEQSRKIFIESDKLTKETIQRNSSSILKTTGNIINSKIDDAKIVLSQEGIDQTAPNIITEALPDIREQNRNRAGTISETEIGTASSIGSEAEDEIFTDAIDDIKKNPQNAETIGMQLDDETLDALNNLFPDKTWITELDNVVREWHLAAHGQKKPTKEPFIVGGELLKYPRDSSLGASTANIINCRCQSISS